MSTAPYVFAVIGRGWLLAFVVIACPVLGALALSQIGSLTGGEWSKREPLVRLATFTPWLCLIVLPPLILTPIVFPGAESRPAQLAVWLAPWWIAIRTAVFIAAWSLFSMWLFRTLRGPGEAEVRHRRARLPAALGLVFYAAVVGVVSVDWIMALEPPWISSAGGMRLAVVQMALALGWCLAFDPDQQSRGGKDMAGLLAAMSVANLYFNLMTYLIPWYGDLPDRTSWFRHREGWGWGLVLTFALVIGSGAPLALLGMFRGRHPDLTARAAGVCAVVGFSLQIFWMMLPPLGLLALIPTGVLLAIAAAGSLFLAMRAAHERQRVLQPAPAQFRVRREFRPPPREPLSEPETALEEPGPPKQPSPPLESPEVRSGLLIALVAGGLAIGGGCLWGILAFYHWGVGGATPPVVERSFPSPRLNQALRAGASGPPAGRVPLSAASRSSLTSSGLLSSWGPSTREPISALPARTGSGK